MAKNRVFSGSSFEETAGYARAVISPPFVFVSGTTGFDYTTGAISADPAEQTERCFTNINAALTEAGSVFADVVRIRIIVADAQDFPAIAAVVGRHCRPVRPANTTIIAQLVDPRMKVEIEVTAMLPV